MPCQLVFAFAFMKWHPWEEWMMDAFSTLQRAWKCHRFIFHGVPSLAVIPGTGTLSKCPNSWCQILMSINHSTWSYIITLPVWALWRCLKKVQPILRANGFSDWAKPWGEWERVRERRREGKIILLFQSNSISINCCLPSSSQPNVFEFFSARTALLTVEAFPS